MAPCSWVIRGGGTLFLANSPFFPHPGEGASRGKGLFTRGLTNSLPARHVWHAATRYLVFFPAIARCVAVSATAPKSVKLTQTISSLPRHTQAYPDTLKLTQLPPFPRMGGPLPSGVYTSFKSIFGPGAALKRSRDASGGGGGLPEAGKRAPSSGLQRINWILSAGCSGLRGILALMVCNSL